MKFKIASSFFGIWQQEIAKQRLQKFGGEKRIRPNKVILRVWVQKKVIYSLLDERSEHTSVQIISKNLVE